MEELKLDKALHVRYWKRCLKSVLPTAYTSNDSSRMALGFFILSALDLLSADTEIISEAERANIRDWILKCQHPNGGFCGSMNHRYPDGYYVDVGHGEQLMEPANLPATFFAILSLTFVGRLDQMRRRDCLMWLKTLQREDGSFGELITAQGTIQGGRDMRYCYVATMIRSMLRGDHVTDEDEEDDIDVEKLVDHLRSGQTYDGGISESSSHESHAGYTYCAIASLKLLNRLPDTPTTPSSEPQTTSATSPGLTDVPALVHWLVSRQVGYSAEDDEEELAQDNPAAEQLSLEKLSLQNSECVGFNGRCNKPADTCYVFWVGGALDIIGHTQVIDPTPVRRFLFEETQHHIGGFGKYPGSPPDIYHSYLGLAALATWKEEGLKAFDPVLCISMQQRAKIDAQREDARVPTRRYWKNGYSFSIREDDPAFTQTMADSENPPKLAAATSQAVK